MRIVLLGLSITSSWGNGHATNYRALALALRRRGHRVLFLERDVPWYAAARDFTARWVRLYRDVEELESAADDLRRADLVLVGSYVPDGCEIAALVLDRSEGVTAFWDLDTPVTAAKLARGDHEYLSPDLVRRFDLYLSFTAGPLLAELGARRPVAFHCLVDPGAYRPLAVPERFTLGYLGTYAPDRQAKLEELLLEPARRLPGERFAVAGPQYPPSVHWPANVGYLESLPPPEHAAFYAAQRFTLNLTRADMAAAGWSPSVRLFEAAACAVPVITDAWAGLDSFFEPGREILVARDADDVARHLREGDRAVGRRARARVLAEHTAERRVEQLERLVAEVREEVHV
jgi:spore maturation protein CgeB